MPKTKFPAVISTFCLCFVFWLLLTWSFTAQEMIAGAVVSLAAALFASKFFIHENAFWLFNPVKLGAIKYHNLTDRVVCAILENNQREDGSVVSYDERMKFAACYPVNAVAKLAVKNWTYANGELTNGDWTFAFHPRVTPLLPVCAGIFVKLFSCGGFLACQLAASLLLSLCVFHRTGLSALSCPNRTPFDCGAPDFCFRFGQPHRKILPAKGSTTVHPCRHPAAVPPE